MASDEKKRKLSECLPDLFAETLECPVCLETINDPPIFLCEKGHELCEKCRDQLKAQGKPCPVCQGKLTDARNWAVEKMLEKLPKTECKHEGCTFARSDTQWVKNHEEKECRLKPVKCEVCLQHIAMSQIHGHLVTNHNKVPSIVSLGEEGVKNSRLAITPSGLGNCQTPLNIVNSDLKFLANRRYYDTNITMWWVSFCGTQVEANEYEYTIKIKNPTEQRENRKYLFTGTRDCVSCDVSHEDMKVKGDALLLNKALLERAANEKDEKFLKFDCCVVIKKKE